MGRPTDSPDCRDSKHRACTGASWDAVADQPAWCSCGCHTAPVEARPNVDTQKEAR